MVFNVLAWNCDDHVKNMAFLMDHYGQWSLAPGYDITYSYKNMAGAWTNAHQMSVNGKFSGIGVEDMVLCAREANMPARKARAIVSDIADVVLHWQDFAGEAGVEDRHVSDIGAILALTA